MLLAPVLLSVALLEGEALVLLLDLLHLLSALGRHLVLKHPSHAGDRSRLVRVGPIKMTQAGEVRAQRFEKEKC